MHTFKQQLQYTFYVLFTFKNKSLISLMTYFLFVFILIIVHNHVTPHVDCMSDDPSKVLLNDLNDSSDDCASNDKYSEQGEGSSCDLSPEEIEEIFEDREIFEEEHKFFCTHSYEENREAGIIESARDSVFLQGFNIFDTESSELEITQECLDYSITELERARQSSHDFFVKATKQEQTIKNLDLDVKYLKRENMELVEKNQQLLSLINDFLPRENIEVENAINTTTPDYYSDYSSSNNNETSSIDSETSSFNEQQDTNVESTSSFDNVLIYDYGSDDNPDR